MRSFLVLVLLAGCGDPSESDLDTDVADTDVTADAVDYARDVQPIFDKHCVSCHQSPGYVSPSFEDLTEVLGKNTAFCEDGELPFIVPGDPDASFLVYKIGGGGDHAPKGAECKELMPNIDRQSLADLDPAAVATIRRWIAEGAHID